VESALDPTLGSASRLKVAATSCARIEVPSVNRTPRRILKVQTLPSLLGFQLVAITG
jgi:hypothetical protein